MLFVFASLRREMEAENLAPLTIHTYQQLIGYFAAWLAGRGHSGEPADITTDLIQTYLTEVLTRTSPANAAKHQRHLSRFFKWMAREEEIDDDPMRNMRKIKVAANAGRSITVEDLRALLATCGSRSFGDLRDLAILRVFIDNGMRVSGMAGIRYTPGDPDTNDVLLDRRRVRITLKGGEERWVPIGREAVKALDRYIRARRKHPHAESPHLWLPERSNGRGDHVVRLRANSIAQMIGRRCKQADIAHINPHALRQTMAVLWEGDPIALMDIGGWKSLEMVRHYQRSQLQERAMIQHRQLSPGDKI